jgi:limonene 1,2-monooxygenase
MGNITNAIVGATQQFLEERDARRRAENEAHTETLPTGR